MRRKGLISTISVMATCIKKAADFFLRHIQNKFIRFVFVGGLNTAFGLSIYWLLIFVGVSYIWATLIGHILGVIFNFFTTGNLVFENKDKRLIFRFVLNYVVIYFINIGINRFSQDYISSNTYLSGIIATFASSIFSFFLMKYFVYRSNEKD